MIDIFDKGRVYLQDNEQPPHNEMVHEGLRGGRWYETHEKNEEQREQTNNEPAKTPHKVSNLKLKRLEDIKKVPWETEFDWGAEKASNPNVFSLENDGIQGTISLKENKKDKIIEVSLLESNPNRSYPGVGSRCIAEAVKMSQQNGYDGEVMLLAATDAIPFYEKLGFTQIGRSQIMVLTEARANSFLEQYKKRYEVS